MRLALMRQRVIASVWRTRRFITDKGEGNSTVRSRTLAPTAVVLHADDTVLRRDARELLGVLAQFHVFRQIRRCPGSAPFTPDFPAAFVNSKVDHWQDFLASLGVKNTGVSVMVDFLWM